VVGLTVLGALGIALYGFALYLKQKAPTDLRVIALERELATVRERIKLFEHQVAPLSSLAEIRDELSAHKQAQGRRMQDTEQLSAKHTMAIENLAQRFEQAVSEIKAESSKLAGLYARPGIGMRT
jgi:predicted  nucleic acid-binding Zn-ribbon protein